MPLTVDCVKAHRSEKAERLEAWRCIGCGRIEAPRPCIGICEDRKVELVAAADYEEALARAERLRQERRALETLVRQLASTTPRDEEWKRSYLALQEKARRALAMLG